MRHTMKNVMDILAKEIKRVRILIGVMRKFPGFSHKIPLWDTEVDTLRRILALMIKSYVLFGHSLVMFLACY
jgi:hypothetical protein